MALTVRSAEMAYALGIDIGTTFSSAAIARHDQVEVVALETHRVTVPTVIFADGEEMVFGTTAVRRGISRPVSAAREFKRRLGDSVPVILSSTPYSADRLVALTIRWVADTVAEQLGGPPTAMVVTHPANWTAFQLDLLAKSLPQAGLEGVQFLSEPEAAAYDFSAASDIAAGDLILVYDLGGGTFDIALLQRGEGGLIQIGEAAGVERLGGIDFDEAVFQHVVQHVPAAAVDNARSSEEGRMALGQLRRSCVDAKEELSSAALVDIPVVLPTYAGTVRLTRSEYEGMIRPLVGQTIGLIRTVLTNARVDPDDLSAILLVGGASRTPLVSELVGQALDSRVRVDAHPKLVVARGAARWAGEIRAPPSPQRPPDHRRRRIVVAGVIAVGALGVAAIAVRSATDDPADEPSAGGATAPATSPTTTAGQPATTTPVTTAPPTPLTVTDIRFLGAASIPAGLDVQGTTVGGLSGISYDAADDVYVAISDDLVSPRAYRLEITLDGGTLTDDGVTVAGVTNLVDESGAALPAGLLEGDGIAVAPVDAQSDVLQLVVCNEGNAETLIVPSLVAFDPDGRRRTEVAAPQGYEPTADGSSGMQPEGGCSGVTVTPGTDPMLMSAMELPLRQDLALADEATAPIARVLTHDLDGAFRAEFAYPLGPTTPSSVPVTHRLVDLAALDDLGSFLTLEISAADGPSSLHLYEATLGVAVDDGTSRESLTTVEKSVVLDFAAAGLPVGEFQGMAIGPALADGHRALIIVLDNSFAADVTSDVLAFDVQLESRPG